MEWKVLEKYPDYMINNYGDIYSVKSQKKLKPMVATNGYLIACLWIKGKQIKRTIHRLVAETFIPNPNHLSDVNHIDEDKTNNYVDNLEWCSHAYNMNYGHVREKISEAHKGKIISEEHRLKLSKNSLGRIWINNGSIEKLIYPEELINYTSKNYKKGRK